MQGVLTNVATDPTFNTDKVFHTGTYTLDADCTGTFTPVVAGNPIPIEIFANSRTGEFVGALRAPGILQSLSWRRIGPVDDEDD